jgi:hypothetical protein
MMFWRRDVQLEIEVGFMMFHDFGDGGGFTSCAFFDMLQYLSSNLSQDPLQALPGVVILAGTKGQTAWYSWQRSATC